MSICDAEAMAQLEDVCDLYRRARAGDMAAILKIDARKSRRIVRQFLQIERLQTENATLIAALAAARRPGVN